MKITTSKYKKMVATLGMVMILSPLAILPEGFGSEIATAYAAENTAPTTQNIDIQKVMYSGTMPSITNDGSIQTLPSGVTPFDSSKYGEVQFTIVDITTHSKTKSASELQAEVDALTQEEYEAFIDSNKSSSTTPLTKSVDAAGKISFADVAATNPDGTGHTYAIFETKSAKGLVNQIAKPIIVTLPMTNVIGNGWFSTINLYPKNEVKDLAFELVKYSEGIGSGNELQAAEFDLYQGTPGSGTKINGASLVTDSKGVIRATGLTVGDYYFVETKSAGENTIGGSALNDSNNKLTFTITADGVEETGLKIDFVNYLKPTSKKEVTNGTDPKTNHSTFTIGDTVNYINTIKVPKDIAGGELVSNGVSVITTPYHVFNYSDTAGTGLSYFGEDTDVTVVTESGEALILGEDYTYTAKTNGFSLDFIVKDGKVSDKVAGLAGETITVKYDMILNESAVIDGPIENSFDLSWSNNPNETEDTNHITGKVPVFTGGAKFVKEDASTKVKLKDAKFVIQNVEGNYFDGWTDANSDGVKDAKWSAVEPTTGAGVFTSNDQGEFEIAGLEYGTYTLKEIQAPEGYQLLSTTVNFEIKDQTYTTELSTIENSKRPTMPITGSTQLIITLIGGVALISVAGIYYKKRQQA